jgi:hypothetical protein
MMKLKTFSFLDSGSQDLLKINDKVVKIEAEDHCHAQVLFIESGEVDKCDNWTNEGTVTWCWEDME